MLFPVETPFKFEVAPLHMADGVAVTEEGTEGAAETVIVVVTKLVQPVLILV